MPTWVQSVEGPFGCHMTARSTSLLNLERGTQFLNSAQNDTNDVIRIHSVINNIQLPAIVKTFSRILK